MPFRFTIVTGQKPPMDIVGMFSGPSYIFRLTPAARSLSSGSAGLATRMSTLIFSPMVSSLSSVISFMFVSGRKWSWDCLSTTRMDLWKESMRSSFATSL